MDKLFDTIHTMTKIPLETMHNAGINQKSTESLTTDLENFLLKQYALYRAQHNSNIIKDAERWLLLETIDTAWKQHMLNLDHLKEGIGLRKNPLIEYKKEAFGLFQEMMASVHFDVAHHLFHLNVERFDKEELEEQRESEMDGINLIGSDTSADEPVQRQGDKVGRNDNCPCGSGKKYKKCCAK